MRSGRASRTAQHNALFRAAEYRARDFGPAANEIVGHELYRVVLARVTGRAGA